MILNFLNVCYLRTKLDNYQSWTQRFPSKTKQQQVGQQPNSFQDKKKQAAMLAFQICARNPEDLKKFLQQSPKQIMEKLESNRTVFYGLGSKANILEVRKIRSSLNARSTGALKWNKIAEVTGGGAFIGAAATGGVAAGIVIGNKINADEITSALTENAEKIGDLKETLTNAQEKLAEATKDLQEAKALAGTSPSDNAEKIINQKQELFDSLTTDTTDLNSQIDSLQDIASKKAQALEDVNPDYVEAWQNPDVDAADVRESVTDLGPEIVMPLGIATGVLVLVGLVAVGIYKMRKEDQKKALEDSGLEEAITAIQAEHSLARQNGTEAQFFNNIQNVENALTEKNQSQGYNQHNERPISGPPIYSRKNYGEYDNRSYPGPSTPPLNQQDEEQDRGQDEELSREGDEHQPADQPFVGDHTERLNKRRSSQSDRRNRLGKY